jgi:predicted transglutaminase-like cysteine proteinase
MNRTLTARRRAMGRSYFGRQIAERALSAFAAFVVSCCMLGTAAEAQMSLPLPAPSALLGQGGTAKPTMGWVHFCEEYPSECVVNAAEPAVITLNAKVWQTLVRVNRQVNAAIKPLSDADHWGVEDRWDFAEDGYGDCEDYQLLKRRFLVAAGLPRRALRMTVVVDEDGLGHAVMMVRTDRGEFILDNKRNAVLPWNQTGYTYVKREGDAGSVWASLGGAVSSPIATAGR